MMIPRRLVSYLTVGASGVAVDMVVVGALVGGGISVLAAQAGGWTVAATTNYLLNRSWTWDSDRGLARAWARYLSVDLGKLGIRLAAVAGLGQLALPWYGTTIGGIAVASGIGFVATDRLVFPHAS
jgi:putative flippase GtrA